MGSHGLVKGKLGFARFGKGNVFGIVVSTELANTALKRFYFIPADQRSKAHEFEVEAKIKGTLFCFAPQHLMSLTTKIQFDDQGIAPSGLTEELCKRVRLIMDLG